MAYSQKTIYILFVHHGYGYAGGAPVSLSNLIIGLKQTGRLAMKIVCHDNVVRSFFAECSGVSVDVFENPFTYIGKVLIGLARLESWNSLRIFFSSLFAFPGSILRQFRFFRAEAPDIIHLNSATLFSSAIAARFAHIPVVWHVREICQGGRYCLRLWFAAWLLKTLATKIIAISPAVAYSIGGTISPKVKVVYNPYNMELLNPDLYDQVVEKRCLGYAENTKIILSLGGMSPNKGTVELIEAMSQQDADTVLLFAGPPLESPNFILTKQSLKHLRNEGLPEHIVNTLKPLKWKGFDKKEKFWQAIEECLGKEQAVQYQQQIIQYALNTLRQSIRFALFFESLLINVKLKRRFTWYYPQRVKLALDSLQRDCVRFVGKLKHVAPLLAACDVLVFAGTLPHFPRPVYEAGLMKKPVVVFDMPGVTENVEDGVTGIVVKKFSGKAFGQALHALLNTPDRMIKMGEAGHKKAKSLPDMTEIASSVLSIYEEIASTILER